MNRFLRTSITILSLVCLLVAPLPLNLSSAMANECGDKLDNLTSPFCTDAKYILLSGAILTEGLYISREETVYKIRRKTLQARTLGQWSKAGEFIGWGFANGIYALYAFTYGKTNNSREALENAEFMAEASLYTLLTTVLIKQFVNEPRPGFPDENDSFPSGHASMSFAFAGVVTARHGWVWGGLGHLLAFFISYSRVQDDRHYVHDLVAGATIGLSYAWGIHYNHTKYHKPYFLTLLPTQDMKGGMLTVGLPF